MHSVSVSMYFERMQIRSESTLLHEIKSFICRPNQWTGFHMIGTSVIKELKRHNN